jgi:hypothetical protein
MGLPGPQFIRLAVFVGFFGFAAVCIVFGREREPLRTAFVGALVVGLLFPTVVGGFVPPFADWHFFTDPAPQNETTYSAVVVDADGDEFDYPREAAPPGRDYERARQIATGNSPVSPARMAAYLLERARTHRRSLADGIDPFEFVRYRASPGRLVGRSAWTVETAREMDSLCRLRVYRTVVNTSAESYRITDRERRLVYDYADGGEEPC